MSEMTLHMSVAAKNLLHDAVQGIHRRITNPDLEKGEGVVGYLLAVLLVIAGVAVVRPVILDMLKDEADNIDLDLSGGDTGTDGG